MATQDIYAKIFLNQVEAQIQQKTPTCYDVLSFFKIFSPHLTLCDIDTKSKRKKRWREAELRIHPDKHVPNQELASKIFKELDSFRAKCDALIYDVKEVKEEKQSKKPKLVRSNSSKHPQEYNAIEMFPCLQKLSSFLPADKKKTDEYKTSSSLCINMRGGLIVAKWNRSIGLLRKAATFRSIKDEGKNCVCVEAIKEEIIENGPVVSRSFMPQDGSSCEPDQCPLIVGWKVRNC